MNALKIILGLIPFALFSILAPQIPVGWAAVVALFAAVIVAGSDLRGGVKAVPLVAVATMAVFAAAAFLGSPGVADVLAAYGRGLATLVLAVYVLATARVLPFSTAYAKESAPQSVWGTPTFVAVNRRISAGWGLVLLVMSISHLAAEALAAAGMFVPLIQAALNWGLPIVAIVMMVKFTKNTADVDATTRQGAAE